MREFEKQAVFQNGKKPEAALAASGLGADDQRLLTILHVDGCPAGGCAVIA